MAFGGVDWIYMAEDRDQWRTLVNTVVYLLVPWNAWLEDFPKHDSGSMELFGYVLFCS
jgi:hypothetical protein